MLKRICELREQLEDLIDYTDLLKARAQNLGKRRYSTEQVKKMLIAVPKSEIDKRQAQYEMTRKAAKKRKAA